MEDKHMKKPAGEQPPKKTELEKSTYVKDKEREAAEAAREAEKAARKAEKQRQKANRPPLKERMKSQRFRHGTTAKVITVLVIAALVLVNVLFSALSNKFPNMNIDMTTGSINSLSDQVKSVVQSVKKDTDIIIIGTEEQVRNDQLLSNYGIKYSQVATLTDKMHALNPKIKVSYKDLDADPTFANDYKDDNLVAGDVIVKTADRSYVVKYSDLFNISQDQMTGAQAIYTQAGDALAAGISNANASSLPVVAFDTGHEEQLPTDAYKSLLKSNNFDVKDFNLLTDDIPENTQFIMLAAPKNDYTEDEIKKLDDFLSNTDQKADRGLLVTFHANASTMPVLCNFLKEWGLTVENKIVAETDANQTIANQPYFLLANAGTATTLNEKSSYQYLIDPQTQPVTVASSANGLTTSALLTSSDTTAALDADGDGSDINTAAKQSYTLAGMGEKTVKTGSEEHKACVVAMGGSMFFTQTYLQSGTFSNGTWATDLAKYVTGTVNNSSVTITPVQTNTADISMSSAVSGLVGIGAFTILIPVACFVAGIVVYRKRRKL